MYTFAVTNQTTKEVINFKAENRTELRHKMINTLDMSYEYSVKAVITQEMVESVKKEVKKTFVRLNVVGRFRTPNGLDTVEIVKYMKAGTKREFFVAEYSGQRIGSTLWARKYDAERVAQRYILTKLQ